MNEIPRPKNTVATKHVNGRRSIHYLSLDELLEDSRRLADCDSQTLGNWSQGQIYEHLARSLDVSIEGTKLAPAPLRFILRLLFMKTFLNKKMPAGFKTSAKMTPAEISTADGLASLSKAVARQRAVADRAMHPGFGKINRQEWELFHLRHAEMHMSFIVVPDTQSDSNS